MSICPTCNKRVYYAERLSAAGKDYHRRCFKWFVKTIFAITS